MNPLKMLGLAVVASLAAMALVGVSSASATAPYLCKANETPCEGSNQIGKAGVAIESSLASNNAELKGEGVPPVKCQKSEVDGETTDASTQQLIGEITNLTFENCHVFVFFSCTATPLQLPYTAHLEQDEVQGNGTMSVGPENSEAGQPGARVQCIDGTDCTFKGKETQSEEAGFESEEKWVNLEAFGGAPATIVANQVELKNTEGEDCPEQATWNATYEITNPNPAYLSHQE